jgi:peptidoglycan/LPS O-acetylase OafA/YrhL
MSSGRINHISDWCRSNLFSPPTEDQYAAAQKVGHFYGIDLLRGLAALVVLIHHYQFFFMASSVPHGGARPAMSIPRTREPLYQFLWPFYEHGFWAVQAFWIISGFVFAHVYAGKKTSGKDFSIARFSRLYPLHFITLILITAVQLISIELVGGRQLTGFVDLYHFFLNLFFISSWGFQMANSFNEPIWSVSLELAAYAVFFFLARRIFSFGVIVPFLFMGLGGAVMNQGTPIWLFGICFFFYFQGVLAYYVLLKFRRHQILLVTACALSLGYFFYLTFTGEAASRPFYNVQSYLFLPIIMLLGMLDLSKRGQHVLVPFRWFGDATYSMFLWHFPIQVAVLVAVVVMGLSADLFTHPLTLMIWVVGMICLSVLSFRYLEKPLQIWSRRAIRNALDQPDRT